MKSLDVKTLDPIHISPLFGEPIKEESPSPYKESLKEFPKFQKVSSLITVRCRNSLSSTRWRSKSKFVSCRISRQSLLTYKKGTVYRNGSRIGFWSRRIWWTSDWSIPDTLVTLTARDLSRQKQNFLLVRSFYYRYTYCLFLEKNFLFTKYISVTEI